MYFFKTLRVRDFSSEWIPLLYKSLLRPHAGTPFSPNQPITWRTPRRATVRMSLSLTGLERQVGPPGFAPLSFLSRAVFFPGDEQRGGGLYRAEAGVRHLLQPLVCREVPEGRPERRPVHGELPEVPALRAGGHQGEGDPHRRRGLHGAQQGQAWELMDGCWGNPTNVRHTERGPRGPPSMRRSGQAAVSGVRGWSGPWKSRLVNFKLFSFTAQLCSDFVSQQRHLPPSFPPEGPESCCQPWNWAKTVWIQLLTS